MLCNFEQNLKKTDILIYVIIEMTLDIMLGKMSHA